MEKNLILLAEDDFALRELCAYELRRAGFLVHEAVDGEDALRKFTPTKHGMVITDLAMPGKNGLQVISRIKELAPHVPVLVVTAFGYQKIVTEAKRAGADWVLFKPCSRWKLIAAVRKLMTADDLDELEDFPTRPAA